MGGGNCKCQLHEVKKGTCHLYLTMFKPTVIAVCHVYSVELDVDISPGQHTECPHRPAARISKKAQKFLGLLPCFFLQSRNDVLDCGHSSGEQSQCHKTTSSHIQFFCFFPGFMADGPCFPCIQDPMTLLRCWLHEEVCVGVGSNHHLLTRFQREPRRSTLHPPQVYRKKKLR